MEVMPRPPLRQRIPSPVRTTFAWIGVAAYPLVVLIATTTAGAHNVLRLGQLPLVMQDVLPVVMMLLPMVLLRRAPLVTLMLMLGGFATFAVVVHSADANYLVEMHYIQLLATDIGVAVIAAVRSRRVSIPTALVTLLFQVAVNFLAQVSGDPVGRAEIAVLALVLAWMIGNSARVRSRYAEALYAQAATQAVTEERLRIARELHDMVAHSVAIIAIQAGVGGRVIDTQPAEARTALRSIEETSRETLAGLRRVVTGLRRDDAEPIASLAELDRLIARSGAGGLHVKLRWPQPRRAVPGEIDLAAYRIIQEALANVIRHAGAAECAVTVDDRGDDLVIEVVDDGCGGPVAASGFGLVGMRERVGALHGEFEAGPRPEGGFRVMARLPLPAEGRLSAAGRSSREGRLPGEGQLPMVAG